MTDTLILHSFGLNDRGGKLRWLCGELGIPVEEARVKPGDHFAPPYTDLNPYSVIPAAEWRGETMIESTATCQWLAEQFPDRRLTVRADEPERRQFLQWVALFAETFEAPLVQRLLAGMGYIDPAHLVTTKTTVERRFPALLERLPTHGFLVADRFTLADIEAAYSLRLAIAAGLIDLDRVGGYLRPLMERPAARAAQFFSSIEG